MSATPLPVRPFMRAGASLVPGASALAGTLMITARPKKTNVSPDPKNGLRVLVVEDEPDTAASMAWLLGLWGHEARVARDGETALECLRNGCPDVVLLDLGLPGMGG